MEGNEAHSHTWHPAASWPQTFENRALVQWRGHFGAPADGGYVFDANGNVRNRAGQEFIWDAENHLAQVNWGSPLRSEYYSYDEAGVRVRKAEGMTGGPVTANTYYLFSHYERRTSGGVTTPTRRYFFGNMLIAQDEGGQFTYLHTDHLGSIVLQTDTNGNVVNDQRYFAFGRRLDKSGDISGEIDFTGQKRDATGLLYFNARYYDPQIGQFISPDTIVPDPTLLIDYNRYLYSRGNPLKYNDPTGHIPEREACSYLRACSEDEFVNKYGQELANLLWGTDVTWGDKVSWDNDNTGMLVLLEAGDGRHTGVLWGIAGRGAGEPIYLDMLHKEGITSFDTTEATDVDTVWDLPMDPDFKYGGYYPTEYVDISELWWLTTVGGMTGVGQKVGRLVGGVSVASQTIEAADTVDDLQIVQSLETNQAVSGVAQGASYWWSKTFGQAWTSYPTVRFSPSGSLGFTLHLKGPGGAR